MAVHGRRKEANREIRRQRDDDDAMDVDNNGDGDGGGGGGGGGGGERVSFLRAPLREAFAKFLIQIPRMSETRVDAVGAYIAF
jgi:hypothetical protein